MTELNKLVERIEEIIAMPSPVCEGINVPIIYMIKTEEIFKANGCSVINAIRAGKSFVFTVCKEGEVK